MDIFDLLDKLEEISYDKKLEEFSYDNKTDCPYIYIQIGDIQVPLYSVKYCPESDLNYGAIILSSE